MAAAAKHREIAIKFSDKGFGKRPDAISYPAEIISLAKEGATSFHSSEELWQNPLNIKTGMSQKEVEKLRIGWDLIIDIDAPVWDISRAIAWLIIKAFNDFGISSTSVKFSGNKGFHIGIPFEAFPTEYKGQKTAQLFPQAPRSIAKYLIEYIAEQYIEVQDNEILIGKGCEKHFKVSFEKLTEITGKNREELTKRMYSEWGKGEVEVKEKKIKESIICPYCEKINQYEEGVDMISCSSCKKHIRVERSNVTQASSNVQEEAKVQFNALAILEVDTILISSRHLFRMPYSLHEKSGLVSLPFNPEKILDFKRKFAHPEIVKASRHVFLDRTKAKGEATDLLEKAMRASEQTERKRDQGKQTFEEIADAIPETLFPPSIKRILEGLEDGRKRALFILINFLQYVGWSYDKIEQRLKEWNQKNAEPLRETVLVGQLRYRKQNKEKILPPNFDNDYYQSIGITPTDEEKRYKNPVKYSVMMAKRKGGKKEA